MANPSAEVTITLPKRAHDRPREIGPHASVGPTRPYGDAFNVGYRKARWNSGRFQCATSILGALMPLGSVGRPARVAFGRWSVLRGSMGSPCER